MPTFSMPVIKGAIRVPNLPFMGLKINPESMTIVGPTQTEDGRIWRIVCYDDLGTLSYYLYWEKFDGKFTYGGCSGRIMIEGEQVPELDITVVTQFAPGLYSISDWSGIRADLVGSIQDISDPHDFAENLTYVLTSVGYMKPNTNVKNNVIDIKDLMSVLRDLIDKTDVKHQTKHMTKIFEFMNAVWMVL